ncbi:MAG: hypothetical protein J0M36_07710 [Caulobacterales bacterium]|nr:hypothetical protein [Caulobacterales bacterium]
MSDRRRQTDRLIAALGVLVLALGAAAVWKVAHEGGLFREPESAGQRALRQVRAELGRGAEVRYIEAGIGAVSCGYAARGPGQAAVAFVSRPQRILFGDDPLPREFAETRDRYCPGFAQRPGVAAS